MQCQFGVPFTSSTVKPAGYRQEVDASIVRADGPRGSDGEPGHLRRDRDGLAPSALVDVVGQVRGGPPDRADGLVPEDEDPVVLVVRHVLLQVVRRLLEVVRIVDEPDSVAVVAVDGLEDRVASVDQR